MALIFMLITKIKQELNMKLYKLVNNALIKSFCALLSGGLITNFCINDALAEDPIVALIKDGRTTELIRRIDDVVKKYGITQEGLDSLMFESVRYGTLEMASYFITKYNCNINFDINGVTPLKAAVQRGYGDMVELLLSSGAQMNNLDELLLTAAKGGNSRVVEQLSGGADGIHILNIEEYKTKFDIFGNPSAYDAEVDDIINKLKMLTNGILSYFYNNGRYPGLAGTAGTLQQYKNNNDRWRMVHDTPNPLRYHERRFINGRPSKDARLSANDLVKYYLPSLTVEAPFSFVIDGVTIPILYYAGMEFKDVNLYVDTRDLGVNIPTAIIIKLLLKLQARCCNMPDGQIKIFQHVPNQMYSFHLMGFPPKGSPHYPPAEHLKPPFGEYDSLIKNAWVTERILCKEE